MISSMHRQCSDGPERRVFEIKNTKTVTYRRLNNPTDRAIPDIEKIYAEAIPETERRPLIWLTHAITRPDFAAIVAEDDQTSLGFATVFLPAGQGNAALLEYLAVDALHRKAGIGAALFNFAISLAAKTPMLIEVESGNNTTCQRRRMFYRRLGCRRITGLSYQLPLAGKNPPPMELMVANAPLTLQRTDLSRWLTTIYKQVYNCASDDPRLAVMLLESPELIALE